MKVRGAVRPPGDKSITHRALMLAGLAHGASELRGALAAGDTRSTARVLRQLGVRAGALRHGVALTIRGASWRAPARTLDCGNSGTTARLMLGLLAAHRLTARLSGDASLRRRPMGRITEPLRQMGARFEGPGDRLPIVVRGGPMRDVEYASPVASAQVKSALLLAGVVARVDVVVEEPRLSRDHTERLLRFLGAPLERQGCTVSLRAERLPWRRVPPFDLTVPGDFSAAAFLVAAALLADDGTLAIEGVGINPTRTGALDVLRRMGARIELQNRREHAGEPVADMLVHAGMLGGTEVEPQEIPALIDEVPVLAVLAARAQGVTRFREVGELRVKESDRLTLLAENLRAVGADAQVEGNDLLVGGTRARLAGRVHTAGDHRLAMAFGVLAAHSSGAVRLSERQSPAVSYPGFSDDLSRVLYA